MRTTVGIALVFALVSQTAQAADQLSGSGALALAALVGAQSPHVSAHNKRILAAMLGGNLTFSFPAKGSIAVKADAVTCRSSNVDISAHDCTLTFGPATRTFKGRLAHELYATLIENGVPGDGAAGSNFESLAHLACTIKPAEVKERGGGGASCTIDAKPGS